jgi:hypothetical protein
MLKGHSILTVSFLWFLLLLLLLCQGAENVSIHGEGGRFASSSSASFGSIAYGASDYTRRNFLTSFGDYRVSNKGWESQWVYCWPTFAQVYADVGMLELSLLNQTYSTSVTINTTAKNNNNEETLLFENYILSSLDWMEKVLWKPNSLSGGFFAAAFVNEGYVDTSLQYVDDNAFAGVVYLECVREPLLFFLHSSTGVE